jgi:hypothetical protein
MFMERFIDHSGFESRHGIRPRTLAWTGDKNDQVPPGDPASRRLPVPPNPLERLTQIVQSNDHLLGELQKFRGKVNCARAYLDDPRCNIVLGTVSLNWARTKHTGVLAQLRANRIEANHILGNSASSAPRQAS